MFPRTQYALYSLHLILPLIFEFMALICMAVYDTEENGRSEYTERTIESLTKTVDWNKHRLIVVDNGSCQATKDILQDYKEWIEFCRFTTIITLSQNVGTARGINFGMKLRKLGEAFLKIDNDVVINQSGWVDEMEEVIRRDPKIGIVGLKRKDVNFDGTYISLPHKPGERWVTVETGGQIMGTCTMFNPLLIEKIGGFSDCSIYGFDDMLMDLRSSLAGFYNCYLPHIDINHIDRGDNPYTIEKQKIAKQAFPKYTQLYQSYIDGARPLYEEL